jgi:cation transport protein ChaC
MSLTRSDLETGRLRQLISQTNPEFQPLSEAELQASLQQTLAKNPGQQIWLFAYGSLIWNPVVHFAERRVGTIHGFHRRFCLWTPLGRGTPDNPGLVLGLDRGGSCRGIVYRMDSAIAETELQLVWRREMVVGSYIPRWVKVIDKKNIIYAITFVINKQHRSYTGSVPQDVIVQHIATAAGMLGSCADYLNQTIASLAEVDIHDRGLLLLQRQVMAKQALLAEAAPVNTHDSME